jgi:hypothetical protein
MNAMERRLQKAEEYRARAKAASEAAGAASLDSVRANHTRAEQRWTELAEAEDARVRHYRLAPGAAG